MKSCHQLCFFGLSGGRGRLILLPLRTTLRSCLSLWCRFLFPYMPNLKIDVVDNTTPHRIIGMKSVQYLITSKSHMVSRYPLNIWSYRTVPYIARFLILCPNKIRLLLAFVFGLCFLIHFRKLLELRLQSHGQIRLGQATLLANIAVGFAGAFKLVGIALVIDHTLCCHHASDHHSPCFPHLLASWAIRHRQKKTVSPKKRKYHISVVEVTIAEIWNGKWKMFQWLQDYD